MEEHGVVGGSIDRDADRAPEKGNIIQAVLEEFWDASISENISDKAPYN